jgi:hypothetical protein
MNFTPAVRRISRIGVVRLPFLAIVIVVGLPAVRSMAQTTTAGSAEAEKPDSSAFRADQTVDTPANVLSTDDWLRLDKSVERALEWLSTQQRDDGSFATLETGQPAVTSLCMMAFMAHGHVPGEGKYGGMLDRATQFVLSCQKQNGLVALIGPDGPRIDRNVEIEVGVTAAYNHAISSLTLSELYGLREGKDSASIIKAIQRAVTASLEMQRWQKSYPADRGGWRYLYRSPGHRESDLSITGWELMFLRSARNAGFDVAEEPIDAAVEYVRRCYSEKFGVFQYIGGDFDHRSRGMAGAGILALAHAGFHRSAEADSTGNWIIEHNFDRYNEIIDFNPKAPHERYHYSLFMCCQGMYQLGGRYWEEFFPRTVQTVMANQRANGSWQAEVHWRDGQFGSAYTTALVVISLGAPNQLLPIFQR